MTGVEPRGAPPEIAWLPPLYANVLVLQMVTFILRPAAIYRGIELGIGVGWLGVLGASFAFLPLLLAIPVGQFADRFGERRTLLVGVITTVGATSVFVWAATSVAGLAIAIMLLGVGHLACAVAQQAMVGSRTPQAKYDQAYGHYTFVVSLGQALGPSLIFLFGGSALIPDTQGIFQWSLGLVLLLVLTVVFLPGTPGRKQERRYEPRALRSIIRLPGLLSAITVSCIVIASTDLTLVYLPLLGSERGLSAGFVGVLLSIRAIFSMVSRFFLGFFTVRLGRRPILTTSVLLSAFSMAALVLPLSPAVLVGVMSAMGMGLGVGQPLTMSWLAASTPSGLLGRAVSLRLMGNRLGQVLIPSAAGGLAALVGSGGVFVVTAGALFGAAIVSRRLERPTGRQ